MNIQWYPGHMTKTRRMIVDQLKNVDAVCEILDSRIPISSRNPDIDELTAGKPRLVVLNRVDQADPEATKQWAAYFRSKGYAVLESDAKGGMGTAKFGGAVRELLADKLRAYAEKGMTGRVVRVMILGIPNVGKSTFINRLLGKKSAVAADKPGVTRSKQWFTLPGNQFDFMDTPGMLWPKIDTDEVGFALAFTGSIRDEILDLEDLACRLILQLDQVAPGALQNRYGIEEICREQPYDTLTEMARKRGFLAGRGEYDTERMAKIFLDEFRGGKLGRITLERAPIL